MLREYTTKDIDMTGLGEAIGYEYEAAFGKINLDAMNYGPENTRDIPCDICPMKDACEMSGKECVAFRNWATKGNFTDSDMTRLLR